MTDLLALDAGAVVAGIGDGSFRAVDIATAYLAQRTAVEPWLSATLAAVPEQDVLAQASAIDRARAAGHELGPLAGVPVALKDIFVTRGLATTCGSRILSGWQPPYQGTHAQRLLDAGAILLGKLAMDEFAMGCSSENTPFTPVQNPWSTEHVAGGSSGGSAAAVSARTACVTLGSDTGGSIRQPASLCNVVGLKPTYGRVSRAGMIAFASSLDQAGPLCRTVADAARVLGVIAGHDPADATSLAAPVPDYLAACNAGVAGLRIGVDRSILDQPGLQPAVRQAFDQALTVLRDAGAITVDITLPHQNYGIACYYILCCAEAASNLARYDGLRYGPQQTGTDLQATYRATRDAGFGAEVKRRILLGTHVLRADCYETHYGRAMRVRTLIARDFAQAFAHCDLIASPTSPVAGIARGTTQRDPLELYLSDVFTVGANLAGLPAISIPAGFTTPESGPSLPIGFQLIGPHLAEPTLLAAAASHQARTSWHRQVPSRIQEDA
ncbi:MAG: Asp-tRNA(Asn)/Glu-tRNA(Gln) amidotransferase subunit GatA [Nannocystaceae bacterium]